MSEDAPMQLMDAFDQDKLPKVERAIIALKDLKPAPYNPRVDIKPGDEVYETLKKSILKFGLVDKGIVYNKRTKQLVGGHQRVKVLKDIFGPAYLVEVNVVDLSLEDEKALNLGLNHIANEDDPLALQRLLKEMHSNTPELLPLTGISNKDIMSYLKDQQVEGDVDDEFHRFDEGIKTEYSCPQCGYAWSGKKK